MPNKTNRKSKSGLSDAPWMAGVHSGYDPGTKKYRDVNGLFVTRTDAIHRLEGELRALGATVKFNPDRASRAAESLENIVAGGFSPFDYQEVSAPKNQPRPIPGNVLASYRLAEFYYNSEGDVAAALETPIQVAMRKLDITSPDAAVTRIYEEMYDVDNLDMAETMMSMWLSMAVYGIAHPFEAYVDGELRGIVLLPPLYTAVGSRLSDVSILPTNPSVKEWTEESLKTLLPTAMYQSLGRGQEEMTPVGQYNLPDGSVHSIRALDQRWVPYPKPLQRGAFRALSTRIIYEEMRRATYEGFRHQLWLFLLGDQEHQPSPQMMRKLMDDIEGMSGERTGSLAWWGALSVKVLTPNVSEFMSSEEWWMLSLDIFRRLGLNMRVTTGNVAQGERQADFEIDADIMLEKFEFMRSRIQHWERGFRLRYAKISDPKSKSLQSAVRDMNVQFAANMMELKKTIKDRLLPLFTVGSLSPQSLLAQSGQDYAVERANKLAIKGSGEEEMWFAPPTYSQTTALPTSTPKQSSTSPVGQPNPNPNGHGMMGQQNPDLEKKKRQYLALILVAFHELAVSQPEQFIADLKAINARQLVQFAQMGYTDAKGMMGAVPAPWDTAASSFVNSFADAFGTALRNGTGTMDNEKRALMYGEEGYRTAYLQGVQAAMSEHRATHWRRVLHPEASTAGPCPLCMADSQIVHGIDEPFMSLHPNESCTMAPISVRFSGAGGQADFGIPGLTENQLSDLLKNLHGEIDHLVRRPAAA